MASVERYVLSILQPCVLSLLTTRCSLIDRLIPALRQAGHLRAMCTSSTMDIDVKSRITDRAKITESTARGPPTLEDLDAEMEDYFDGRQEFVAAEQEVGRMTI